MEQTSRTVQFQTHQHIPFSSPSLGGNAGSNACGSCLAFKLAVCGGTSDAQFGAAHEGFNRAPARRTIFHPRDSSDGAFFICSGWAVASIGASDGSRQITSVLLPGDTVSMFGSSRRLHNRAIEAVTDVIYRNYSTKEWNDLLVRNPRRVFSVVEVQMREREAADRLALDLGRRNSEQRIARLILDLYARLEKRGMARGTTIDFPLRQRQIADATGLTPVHVCKVLGGFESSRYISIAERKLEILNLPAFQRIAS